MNSRIAFLCVSTFTLTLPLTAQFKMDAVLPDFKKFPDNVSLPKVPFEKRETISKEDWDRVNGLNKNAKGFFDEEDFAGAASFYQKYRKELVDFYKIEKDKKILKDISNAFLSEIDALIAGNTPRQAQTTLDEFKKWLDHYPDMKNNDLLQLKIPFCEGKIAVLNRQPDAVKHFEQIEKFLSLDEKNAAIDQFSFWFYYGVACEWKQDYTNAIRYFQEAAKSSHMNLQRQARQRSIFCRIQNKQFEEAKEELAIFNSLQVDGKNDLIQKTYHLLDYFLLLKSGQKSEFDKYDKEKQEKIKESLTFVYLEDFQCVVQFLIADELRRQGEYNGAYRIYAHLYVYARTNPARKLEFISRMIETLNQCNESSALTLIRENFNEYLKDNIPVARKEAVAKICLKAGAHKEAMDLYSNIFKAKKDTRILQDALKILSAQGGSENSMEDLIRVFYGDKEKHGPDADFMRGFYFETQGNPARAAKLYSDAGKDYVSKKQVPRAIEAYSKSIELYEKVNNTEDLKDVCHRLLVLNPQDKSFFTYINLLKQEKETNEIHQKYEGYIAVQKDSSLKNRALYENGLLYFKDKAYESAQGEFDKIISSGDKNWIPFAAYWALRSSLEYYKTPGTYVTKYLENILQKDYSDSVYAGFAYAELVKYYLKEKNETEAERFLDDLYADREKYKDSEIFVSALLYMTNDLVKREKYDDADSFLKKYEGAFENNARLHYLWGKTLKEKKLYESAVKKFQRVIVLKGDVYSDVLAQSATGDAGDCLFALQKYDDALVRYQVLLDEEKAGKIKILPKYKAVTMFKFARCKQLCMKVVPISEDGKNVTPKGKQDESKGKNSEPEKIANEPVNDNWADIANLYLDIVYLHDFNDLPKFPYDIFWVMKSFEQLKDIFNAHRNDPKCLERMKRTVEAAKKIGRLNIYSQELKELSSDIGLQINQIEVQSEKTVSAESDNVKEGKAE